MSDAPDYQYSIGNHPDDHSHPCDFPPNLPMYHGAWESVAHDIAEIVESENDIDWPATLKIWANSDLIAEFRVEREWVPTFSVFEPEDSTS